VRSAEPIAPPGSHPVPGYQLRGVRLAHAARRDGRIRADNIVVAYRIAGRLDTRVLSRAVAAVVARHEPLRTVFPPAGERAVATVLAPPDRFPVEDLDARGQTVDDVLRALAARCVDVEHGPVLRVSRVVLGESDELLALTYDHLVADGVESANILGQEVAACYRAFATGTEPVLAPLRTSFHRFAVEQARRLTPERRAAIIASWRSSLPPDSPDPRLDLPPLRPGSERALADSTVLDRVAPASVAAMLPALRGRYRASNFVIFLAGLLASMRMHSDHDEVGALFPVDVRARYGAGGLIGRFSTLAAIWLAVPPGAPFAELVHRVGENVRHAVSDADLPYGELVSAVYPDHYSTVDGPPYVFFAAHAARPRPWTAPGLTAEPVRLAATGRQLHAGLKIGVRVGPDAPLLSCQFSAQAYARDTVAGLLDGAFAALHQVARESSATVAACR
jgi:condensation domain-containing protein